MQFATGWENIFSWSDFKIIIAQNVSITGIKKGQVEENDCCPTRDITNDLFERIVHGCHRPSLWPRNISISGRKVRIPLRQNWKQMAKRRTSEGSTGVNISRLFGPLDAARLAANNPAKESSNLYNSHWCNIGGRWYLVGLGLSLFISRNFSSINMNVHILFGQKKFVFLVLCFPS